VGDRYTSFRNWLSGASVQKTINGWLAIVWLLFGLVGIFTPVKDSIPVLFFISVYANVAGHWAAWQGGRTEVKQEESSS
jgi:hypothetical protein